MKNLILILLSFSFLGFLTGCQKARNKYFDTKISGKVFDFYTKKPLANATVVFGKIQESDFYHAYDSATTDEQGYYEIKSEEKYLEEGWNSVYIVSAKKEGYEITFADKAFDEFDGFYKKVEGSRNNKNVNLYLRKEITFNVKAIDQFPYLDYNSNELVYIGLWQKIGNLGYGFWYPPYHPTLNKYQDYKNERNDFDTTGIKKFVVPFSYYFIRVFTRDPSTSTDLPLNILNTATIDPNSVPDTLKINF